MEAFKNYLFFVMYIACNPKLLFVLPKRVYLPVYIQFQWLKKYPINTVIDIGGHHGNVTQALQFLFPNAFCYIFEPIHDNCQVIRTKTDNTRTLIENLAFSNKSGNVSFYKYNQTELSSLIPLEKRPNYIQELKSEKIKVKTITLDEYFRDIKLKGPVFLKIDTQGTEGIILKHGIQLLKKIDIIHIEISYIEMYKHESLFNEIYIFLTKQGFVYKGEIKESHFYPIFELSDRVNAVFIKE